MYSSPLWLPSTYRHASAGRAGVVRPALESSRKSPVAMEETIATADFCRRTRLPRRVAENLILAGAMDGWGIPLEAMTVKRLPSAK